MLDSEWLRPACKAWTESPLVITETVPKNGTLVTNSVYVGGMGDWVIPWMNPRTRHTPR